MTSIYLVTIVIYISFEFLDFQISLLLLESFTKWFLSDSDLICH